MPGVQSSSESSSAGSTSESELSLYVFPERPSMEKKNSSSCQIWFTWARHGGYVLRWLLDIAVKVSLVLTTKLERKNLSLSLLGGDHLRGKHVGASEADCPRIFFYTGCHVDLQYELVETSTNVLLRLLFFLSIPESEGFITHARKCKEPGIRASNWW